MVMYNRIAQVEEAVTQRSLVVFLLIIAQHAVEHDILTLCNNLGTEYFVVPQLEKLEGVTSIVDFQDVLSFEGIPLCQALDDQSSEPPCVATYSMVPSSMFSTTNLIVLSHFSTRIGKVFGSALINSPM